LCTANRIPGPRSLVRDRVRCDNVLPDKPVRSKNGRKLPVNITLMKKVMNLYYQVPPDLRKVGAIPGWFPESYNIPKYLFRIKGKSFSPKQTCISMLCRLYYLYRYRLDGDPSNNTSYLRQVSAERLIGSSLASIYSVDRWYITASVIFRRLKVLLCPYLRA